MPCLTKARVRALADDDVIEHTNPEKLTSLCQPSRELDVLDARIRYPARMVVRDDDGSRGMHDRAAMSLSSVSVIGNALRLRGLKLAG